MRLGARMLKTGIAVVLSLYICEWFDLQPVLLVVIAAVLTTQPSIYRSFKFFWEQVQGNAIGAVLGIAGVKLLGTDPIVIGLIVVIVIIISLMLKLDASISLAIVTVIAVMGEPDSAVNRVFLILIGVALAMVVNAVVLPPNHEKHLMSKMKTLNERVSLLLRNVADEVFDEKAFRSERKELHQELKKAEELLVLVLEERHVKRGKSLRINKAKQVIFRRMLEALNQEMRIIDTYRKQGTNELDLEIKDNILALAHYHENIVLKFEGKLKIKPSDQANGRHHIVMKENEELLDSFVKNVKDSSETIHGIVLIAALSELNHTLHHLDSLVISYVHRLRMQDVK